MLLDQSTWLGVASRPAGQHGDHPTAVVGGSAALAGSRRRRRGVGGGEIAAGSGLAGVRRPDRAGCRPPHRCHVLLGPVLNSGVESPSGSWRPAVTVSTGCDGDAHGHRSQLSGGHLGQRFFGGGSGTRRRGRRRRLGLAARRGRGGRGVALDRLGLAGHTGVDEELLDLDLPLLRGSSGTEVGRGVAGETSAYRYRRVECGQYVKRHPLSPVILTVGLWWSLRWREDHRPLLLIPARAAGQCERGRRGDDVLERAGLVGVGDAVLVVARAFDR
ncbi:hypothetical protein LX83_005102 [Goodfellowiella coeruleoviolacea]|uniref:Uncharacterized protein n=1 Tax=Goodfellowiella coeruleoviolacea TaxID=334858 RepID=A0AAE3GIZ6_9PSEU|nr:hypothetical protein [Goodfellowiella coeruleoviolacea]